MKSITIHNILGAFLGGCIGFLTCYYLRPALTPLRCLIGVIVGIWFGTTLLRYVQWLKMHPLNRADAITCFVAVTGCITLMYSGHLYNTTILYPILFGVSIVEIGILAASLLAPVLLIVVRIKPCIDMKAHYLRYVRYMQFSAVTYTLYQVKNLICFAVAAFVFTEIILISIWAIPVLILPLLIAGIFVITSLRLFWNCAMSQRYWFCFGGTILTTLITWLTIRDHLTHPAHAWIASLGAGALSVAVTEGVRRTYLYLVEWSASLRNIVHQPDLAVLLESIMSHIAKKISTGTERCVQPIQARFLRMYDQRGFWGLGA